MVVRESYVILTETLVGAYLIHQKRLYDMRKLRIVLTTAKVEAQQADSQVLEMQAPTLADGIAAGRETSLQKSVQLALVRRQVTATAVAAGIVQKISKRYPRVFLLANKA